MSTEVKGYALIVTFKSNLIKHLINTLTPSILPCWVWQHLLDCRMEGNCSQVCCSGYVDRAPSDTDYVK